MEFYDGPTWIVGGPASDDCCVFDNEEMAKWFQKCRSVHKMTFGNMARVYVPIGYISPDVIVTNAAFSLPYAMPYHFVILTSRIHMGCIRRLCGRLREDYRYSNTIVYEEMPK